MGVQPKDVLFVGDSRIDWRAAEAAGCDFALCTYGYGDDERLRKAKRLPPTVRVRSAWEPRSALFCVDSFPTCSRWPGLPNA